MKKFLQYISILIILIGTFALAVKVHADTVPPTNPNALGVCTLLMVGGSIDKVIDHPITYNECLKEKKVFGKINWVENAKPADKVGNCMPADGIEGPPDQTTQANCPPPRKWTEIGTTTGDSLYHFLAPLPCTGGPETGCVNGKLETFDPTSSDANNNKLGEYLNLMIKIFIGICAVLAVIMIVMGGIEYMMTELVSGKEAGKERIRNALLGLLLALGAYTLLNTINPNILKTDLSSLEIAKVDVTLEALPDGSYSSTGGLGGGSCTVQADPNNACSPTKLGCFGNRANEASKICNLESRNGKTDAESGSDKLNNGTGPSYSVGLWQINLTVHPIGGLNCPDAFSGPCGKGTATPSNSGPFVGGLKVGNCKQTIKPEKMQLYKDCVAAAKDIIKNTTVACNLYGNFNFKPWKYSANKCGVSS